MSVIKIRLGIESDIELLTQFNLSMAKETENLQLNHDIVFSGIASVMKDKSLGFYLIAELDNEIAGSLLITYEWSDWRDGLFWWIQSVYVKPQFRRSGIYKNLYYYVKQLSKSHPNIRGFRLYVEESNHLAQMAYESLGMHATHYKLYEEVL